MSEWIMQAQIFLRRKLIFSLIFKYLLLFSMEIGRDACAHKIIRWDE